MEANNFTSFPLQAQEMAGAFFSVIEMIIEISDEEDDNGLPALRGLLPLRLA